jgi:hypothetical protein
MRKGFLVAVAAVVTLACPSVASACDSYMGYFAMRFIRQRAKALGAGVQIQPGSDGDNTYFIPTVDVGFPLGEGRGVVKPMIGVCTGDGTEIVFGGGGAFQLWGNPAGNFTVDGQVAVTAYSFEGGSEQVIPISLMGRLDSSSGSASLVFGAGFQVARYSVDSPGFSESGSDSDPFASIAGLFGSGAVRFQGGLLIKKGDTDTDFAINLGTAIPWG